MAPPSTLAADHVSPQALQPFGATMPLASPTLAISPMRPIAASEPAAAEPLFKFRLGNLLLAQGALEEAATAFREVLVLRPHLTESHNIVVIALTKSGQLTAAA